MCTPVAGGPTGVNLNNDDFTQYSDGFWRPIVATTVAWIHTHPIRTGHAYDEQFSFADLNTAHNMQTPGFLVTPGGTVLRTEPISTAQLGLRGRSGEVPRDITFNDSPVITIFIENIFNR